ncbi:MAG: T9SS type A sorting domain-containing protein [Parafilimonas sp.]
MKDNYLNTSTEINLHDTTLYSFTPNTDTLSYRNRFMLVLNKHFAAMPVAVTKLTNQNKPDVSGVSKSITVKESGVHIYPNPVSDRKAMLHFNNIDKGIYAITIYNSTGQKMASQLLHHTGGDNLYTLMLDTSWPPEIYAINIANEDAKQIINLRLVVTE